MPRILPLQMLLVREMPIVGVCIPSVKTRLTSRVAPASNDVFGLVFGVDVNALGCIGTSFTGVVEGDEDATVPEFSNCLFGR